LLYVNQIAWGSANKHRKLKELPPLSDASGWLIKRFERFGFGEFNWSNLVNFENKTGVSFNGFESELLKNSCDAMQNGIYKYRDEGCEPPYMSEDFRKRRDLAIKQAQEFNDDKKGSK